jgi:hypothetical protein
MISDTTSKLSNIQLELLKLFAQPIPDEQLIEIRNMLSHYFAQKTDEAMDKIWNEKGWTEDKVVEWGNAHYRSSSHPQ